MSLTEFNSLGEEINLSNLSIEESELNDLRTIFSPYFPGNVLTLKSSIWSFNLHLILPSWGSLFSAISSFYDYLTYEGYTFGNPIPAIRKQSPYLLKGATQTAIKRLSKLQWDYVLHCCEIAADKDLKYERMLFLVALLKTLYLRVSELSVRKNWNPIWEHFWIDNDGNQWLKVLGKGNKIRDISVPNALLHYIKRYQNYRIQI